MDRATIELTHIARVSTSSQRSGLIWRTVEIGLASIALAAMAPALLAITLAIYMEDGERPFFSQSRMGKGGRPFQCLKFRSMCVGAEQKLAAVLASDPSLQAEWIQTQKLRNDPRVTRVGAFIRKYSLDEFPQLINVLMGDMSLVGPRPIVRDEISRYGRRIHYYYTVRPGLTGLWQVCGRSDISYRTRVAMDVVYARSRNVMFDLRIIAATIPSVIQSRGSY